MIQFWLTYAAPPLVGMVIGYFTNWLAIKMLFKPHTEKRLLGLRLPFTPGLIPKERERLTVKIAETVSAYVITPDVLAKELASAGIGRQEGIRHALSDKNLGALLKDWGVDDPGLYAEQAARVIFRDERVRAVIVSAILEAIRYAVQNASAGLRGVWDAVADKAETYIHSEAFEAWLNERLKQTRAYVFAAERTVGMIVPEALTDAVKRLAGDALPGIVAYIRKWPDENPQLDGQLAGMLRKIIDENFGRFIGLFIDHQRIYSNIKDGVFTYLSNEENQLFLREKLDEAIDLFRNGTCARWEHHLPDDAFLAVAIAERIRHVSLSHVLEPLTRETFELDELIRRAIPDYEERITVFVGEQLDKVCTTERSVLTDAARQLAERVCLLKPIILVNYLRSVSESAESATVINAGEVASEPAFATPDYSVVFRSMLSKLTAYVAQHMRIKEMIEKKLNAFAVEEVEALILGVVNRELQAITVLGGVLGFLIGLLSLLPKWFA